MLIASKREFFLTGRLLAGTEVKRFLFFLVAIGLMVAAAPAMAQEDQPGPISTGTTIVVSPDGRYVAYTCVDTGSPFVCVERTTSFGTGFVALSLRQAISNGAIAWSPESDLLFYACSEGGTPYVCMERALSFGTGFVSLSLRQYMLPEEE